MQPLNEFIYLASQSPRRQELLKQIGVDYELLLPDEHENVEILEAVHDGEDPVSYVQRVTLLKLKASLARHEVRQLSAAPILCSDTTVALGSKIIGKPENEKHACSILMMLQNEVHQVYSAVAVALPKTKSKQTSNIESEPTINIRLNISNVHMAAMTEEQVRNYVQTGESMGKAGAYAIQGHMAAHIKYIEGSYSGIMGLPLFETAQLLQWARVKQSK